jgi:predicted RNA binding protein with dsRBD fold (UPF0201 family)
VILTPNENQQDINQSIENLLPKLTIEHKKEKSQLINLKDEMSGSNLSKSKQVIGV